ncbi:MAG: hypothetical protein IT290_10340 [Deltaproteobacteria bacterium]|nr:hypothetical protein [Deltaproteobacteria bacterium]
MAQPEKFQRVLQTAEAAEREAGYEFQRIATVFDARMKEVESLGAECSSLEAVLREYGESQVSSVVAGDVRRAITSMEYQRLLRRRLSQAKSKLKERETALSQAEERMKIAQDDLREALIEKKKIETLIALRQVEQRVVQYARDEVNEEEIAQVMRGKRDAE